MNIRYQLWLKFRDGSDVVLDNVEEFEPGWHYLFVRRYDGVTLSFERVQLASVGRRTSPDKDWIPVLMRKPRRYQPTSSQERFGAASR